MSAASGWAEWAWHFEPFLLVASIIGILVMLKRSFGWGMNQMFRRFAAAPIGLVRVAILASFAIILSALTWTASSDIEGFYVILYFLLSLACLLLFTFSFPIMGLRMRDDVRERGNLAAAIVIAGFALGTGLAFAGALTGDDATVLKDRTGEIVYWEGGWHVVVVFFLLAHFELRATCRLVAKIGDMDEDARNDREPSAAVLLAGCTIAAGLIAARAAAGDFIGWREGLLDYFKRLWPMTIIPVIGVLVGRLSGLKANPMPSRAATAGILVAGALAYVLLT